MVSLNVGNLESARIGAVLPPELGVALSPKSLTGVMPQLAPRDLLSSATNTDSSIIGP